MHRLGDDEPQVVGEAVCEPLTPVHCGIGMTERGLHPDFAITQFDRELRYIVCPQIEGAAALEVESGMVPVTGQDPSSTLPRSRGKPICGQRLSSAKTRP